MLQYSPKIITDSLVMCLDASQNKSYPTDLPVKNGLALWLDAADDSTFSYSSGTSVSQWRDKSGLNNHSSQATVGSQPSRSTFQNSRKTVNFDGTNDTVTISNFISNSEMSIFVVSNCGTTLFVEHSTDTNSNSGFYLGGQGTAMFAINRSPGIIYINNTNWLSGGYSIASAVNSTGLDMLAYKNGTQQSLTLDGRASRSNSYVTSTLYIGSRGANSLWSSGPIAEIIIYNRKVTDVERNLIHTYLGQKWGISNTDRSIIDLAGNNDNGLLGNGTVANMPVYNYYNKGGLRFNSSFSNYVISPNTTISGSQTFCVWAVMTGKQNSPTGVLSQHDYASTANFGINILTSNQLAPSIGYTNGTREYQDKTTTGVISYNQIFNAVLVYNAGLNKIYWYINGVFDSEYSLSLTPKSTNWPIGLGRWDPSYDNYYFDGTIFSALVYNKALSAAEVAQNYEAQKSKFANTIVQQGLVLNLDAGNIYSYAGAGTTWYDVSGIGNNGTLTNGPTYSRTNDGNIVFDGTDDYVSIPSNNNFNNGNNITVEAWVLCTNWSSYTHPMIVAKGINVEWILWKSNDVGYVGKLGWRGAGTAYTTTSLPNNTWVQCVGSIGSAGQKVYLNGVLESTVGNTTFTSGNVNVTIAAGLVTGSPANLLGANVAITRIYNTQLTDAQVLQNYNATKGRFGL